MLKTPRADAWRAPAEGLTPRRGGAKVAASNWYAVAVLALINCFALMDRVGLSVLMELIKHDLHLTDAQLGLVSGLAFAVFNVLLGLPLAWIADRYSRVKLISTCLTLWTAMTALSGFAQSYAQLFLARVGVGVGEAGCHPPAHSLISDYVPREKRALGIGLFNTGSATGSAVGMALIGVLGQHFGWRAALQIVGLMGLPLALLAYFTLPDPPRPAQHKETIEPPWRSVGTLLRRPAFVNLVLATSIALVGSMGFSAWLPTFLIRSFHMKMAEAGAWIGGTTSSFAIVGTVVGGLLMSRLFRRDSRWELWLPAGAVAICAPTFVAMILSPHVWVLLLLHAATSFLGAIAVGTSMSSLQSFAEPHRRATAVAIALLLSSLLGTGGGPTLIGFVSTALEPRFGAESLRYALLIVPGLLLWSVAHYALGARTALRDRVN